MPGPPRLSEPIRPTGPLDQRCLLQASERSATNVVAQQVALLELVGNEHVALACAPRQLLQAEQYRLVRLRSREVRLVIGETIANAVYVSVCGVCFDVTRVRGGRASLQQMVNQLQQRSSCHAQATTIVRLRLVCADACECTLAVRMDLELA